MATCVLYVDESGDPYKYEVPLKSGTSPMFVLGGVALPLCDWRTIDREYLELKRRYFLREMQDTKEDRPEHWEAKDLTKPRNWNSDRRQAFLHEVINLLDQRDARLFGIVYIKDPDRPTSKVGLYTSAVQQMADRFNAYVAEHRDFSLGILIMDSRGRRRQDRENFQVASSYLSYVFGSSTGRQLTSLSEAPLFADSRLTAGLQIAHQVSSLIYATHFHRFLRYLPGGYDYSYLQQYWPRLRSLEFRSRHLYDGYQMHGFRVNATSKELRERWAKPQA